jgi:sorting nexin-1/2
LEGTEVSFSFLYSLTSSNACANEADPKGKIPGLDTSLGASSSTQALKSPAGRHTRTPRRAGAQAVRLEAIDDALGPLGPLGDNAPAPINDVPPLPPQKEQVVIRQAPASKLGSQQADVSRRAIDSETATDDVESTAGPRIPPPVQPAQGIPVRRDTQPSVSIEQAANPSFDITVGDPHKVGDLTSSHIVYLVKTKVNTPLVLIYCVLIHTLDHIQGLSSTRIRCHSKIQGFLMAI